MGLLDRLTSFRRSGSTAPMAAPPTGSYAALMPEARQAWNVLQSATPSAEGMLVKQLLERTMRAPATAVGVPDIGFKGVRQQLFQRFNLVDLYAIAHNNSTLKIATRDLKQEVFRRGLRWDPAFTYRHVQSGQDFSTEDIRKMGKDELARLRRYLRAPDIRQRTRFEQLIQRINIYDQSLMTMLKICEDDLNVADDAFIFLSSDYFLGWDGTEEIIKREVKQLFRLDPIFVEFDTDAENRPGFAHHLCLIHREDLLDIPQDEAWQDTWRGRCPKCGHVTFPVVYRYSPAKGTFGMTTGMQGPNTKSLYLVKGEVVHASKFSPSELYGYSPVLSLYEKALSLIGMDRYLYDYFFERQIPQGVITTVTDNPEDLESRKEQMLADTLNNPHHIPWLAVSSKTGQGRTEFVKFAYSLEELQFLPVQEAIAKEVSALYGIPPLFTGDTAGMGGLNNESQQITRLSRGAQESQDVYNTQILPQILDAFGIIDWTLSLENSDEQSEKDEMDMKLQKSQWAGSLVQMGFGVKYDQDTDEYTIYGEVQPQADQQQAMMGGGMM